MRRSLLSFTLSILFVAAGTIPANGNEVINLYYVDDTHRTNWFVELSAERWNRNTAGIQLVEVDSCNNPQYVPCRVIVDKYEDTFFAQWWEWFPESTLGYYDDARKVIELYTWPIETLRYDITGYSKREKKRYRQNIMCHEFGHYILVNGEHYNNAKGCMHDTGTYAVGRNYPGEYLKRKVAESKWFERIGTADFS